MSRAVERHQIDHGEGAVARDPSVDGGVIADARFLHRCCEGPVSGFHEGAPIQGEGAERLRPARQDLRGLSRPFAGHGHERGSSPISIAFGQAVDQPGVHQRRHRRAAVLFHRDARTARPRPSSDDREQATQGAGRAERGGSGASPQSRAGPQVRSRAQRRLRRGPAGVRGREPQGV